MRTRLYNARILPMEDKSIFEGEVWVNDSDIEYVGPSKPSDFVFDRQIDCEGDLLMPSFKNAHAHSAMTFFRSLADNLPLDEWLNTKIFPVEAKFTFDENYWFAKLSILEYLKNGISLACDMYLDRDATNKASDESGFRFSYVSGANDFGGVDTLEESFLKNREYSELVNMNIGFHAEYTTSLENMKKIASIASKYKSPVFVHNSETQREVKGCIDRYGKTPTAIMDEIGMFEYGGGGYHCVHFADRDYEIFKERDLLAVFNPCSNLKLSSGIPDVKRFIDEGISVSVGTDGAGSNNSLNIFRDLYLATVLPNVRGEGNANIDPFILLQGLTSVGPRYMGLPKICFLKEGQKADIIRIDMKDPSMQPVNNIIDNIVFSGSPDIVRMTMVNGKILYEDGKYTTLDRDEIYDICNKRVRELS